VDIALEKDTAMDKTIETGDLCKRTKEVSAVEGLSRQVGGRLP
jgi:hypothetical protein